MPPHRTPPSQRAGGFGSSVLGPWFSTRPALAWAVVGVLFAVVFALRSLAGTAAEAYSMLYALPIALAAVAFGRRAGILTGIVAIALVAAWALVWGVTLSPSGWAARAIPLLVLGYLLGSAVDRARRTEAERRRIEMTALMHQEAIEINDLLIQQIAAAKWAVEAGDTDASERILTQAMADGQRLVSDLITRAAMGERTAAETDSPPSPDALAAGPEPSEGAAEAG